MPASVRRHNLARIRKLLRLTQGDIARMVSCSWSTIKSVEIGKLALSAGLAKRINLSLGIRDKTWLLRNDIDSPLPRCKPLNQIHLNIRHYIHVVCPHCKKAHRVEHAVWATNGNGHHPEANDV